VTCPCWIQSCHRVAALIALKPIKLSRYSQRVPACSVLGTCLAFPFLIKSHIKSTLYPLCRRLFDCNLASLRLLLWLRCIFNPHIPVLSSTFPFLIASNMASPYLYILGIAFAIVTVSYFALNHKQRAVLLSRFGLDRQHRLPWAPQQTPSPAKSELSEKHALPAGQEYKDTFPPSRRPALAELTDNRFSVGGKSGKGLSELPHNTDKSLPDDRNVLAPQYKKYTTPTGFTVEEIKALGNFPDYATLSGVPLPAPYTDFDIKTAMSRPYRPFRWPYHQTMCK
jgi:hypothetical protein